MKPVYALNGDTIAALCTPPGYGGVGIIRVSGALALGMAEKMIGFSPTPRHAHFVDFLDPSGTKTKKIDQGLLLYFPAPHSFTGEAVVEFQGHGGPFVLDNLLSVIIKLGGRLAEPGEFSLRAYLNGKMDLLQAEAIADLINASSDAAQQGAFQSLQGAFSQKITALNKQVVNLRVFVEAALDFPEEEIDFLEDKQLVVQLVQIENTLQTIFEQAKQGCVLQEGKTAVILGAPNAGKSSLFNRLAGKDLAIVTSIPGTTRDIIQAHLNIDGFSLYMLDTAGIRDAQDSVEKEGIKRAHDALRQADIILYIQDISAQENSTYIENKLTDYKNKIIYIKNKIDLSSQAPRIENDTVFISVAQNEGLDLLKEQIKSKVGLQVGNYAFSARRRHLVALESAQNHLAIGKMQLEKYKAGELLAQELRLVSNALESLTGEFTTEDLLGEIFSSFCIGK